MSWFKLDIGLDEVNMPDEPFPAGMLDDIARFFRDDHPHNFPGYDVYHEVFRSALFFPLQRKEELRRMMQEARYAGRVPCAGCDGKGWVVYTLQGPQETCPSCDGRGASAGPKVAMEIGSDKGGGLYHWCMGLPTVERVVACEVRGFPYAALFEKAFSSPKIDFLWLPTSSHSYQTADTVTDWLAKPVEGRPADKIDVLFIDGDKTATMRDFEMYRPLMSDTGLVFIHDVNESGDPRDTLLALKHRGYEAWTILDTSESLEAMRREAEGIPPASPYEGWLREWRGKSCGVGVVKMKEGLR